MREIRLDGCATRPLVGYLKGLGVLRCVAGQIDPRATLRWEQGVAVLGTDLPDATALADFFLDSWCPTPIVSPWNGGSGFHPADNKTALEAIEASSDPRLDAMRAAIKSSRRVLTALDIADKPESRKTDLLRVLRGSLDDDALAWLDATVVLTDDRPGYPPLLGSGGNDGRFDFSNNVAQCLVSALRIVPRQDDAKRRQSAAWLSAALDGSDSPLDSRSLGHLSRDASPTNSPTGESSVTLGNPWDLILAIEGTLLFTAGLVRRIAGQGRMAAPFTLATVAAGYGSAARGEKGRAEVWLPTWPHPTGVKEVEALLREGRASVGRRSARDGVDLVRAARELGVARGLNGFERYALLERAGQSNLAVHAGRVEVARNVEVDILRALDRQLERVRRIDGPASLRGPVRRLETCLFAFADRPGTATGQDLLVALGAIESALAASGREAAKAGLAPLRGGEAAGWMRIVEDGSHEIALAAGLASLRHRSRPPMRDLLHGTVQDRRWRRYDASNPVDLPRTASPEAFLAALLARLHVDEPVLPNSGVPASLATLEAAAAGAVDLGRALALARGMSLLEHWPTEAPASRPTADPVPSLLPLLLAFNGVPGLEPEPSPGPRPGWAAMLAADRVGPLLGEAVLRLQIVQRPAVGTAADLSRGAPRGPALASALLLRPSHAAMREAARRALMPVSTSASTIKETQ